MTTVADKLEPVVALGDKVALITGSASGIGLVTASQLAHAGTSLLLVDRVEASGRSVAEELDARFVCADVGEPRDWDRVMKVAEQSFGGIDLAFLNAGLVTPEPDVTAVSDEAYREMVRANIDGAFYGIRAVVPSIAGRGGGAIVVNASLVGLSAHPYDPVYAMTKHAVVGLVRSLAPQLESKGITINAICSGLVDTPLVSARFRQIGASIGLKLISPTVIAEAVLARMTGADTGQAWICQEGQAPTPYHFAEIPTATASGPKR